MAKEKGILEKLAEKLREVMDAIDEVLSPQPELVPVPVDNESDRRR